MAIAPVEVTVMRTESIALLIAFSLCLARAGSATENTVRVLRVDCGTRAELAKVIRRAPCTAACNEDEVLVTAYCGPRRRAVRFVSERSVSCVWGVTSPLVAVCAKITPQ